LALLRQRKGNAKAPSVAFKGNSSRFAFALPSRAPAVAFKGNWKAASTAALRDRPLRKETLIA